MFDDEIAHPTLNEWFRGYEGEGTVSFDVAGEIRCRFQIRQAQSGLLTATCQANDSRLLFFGLAADLERPETVLLRGYTKERRYVEYRGCHLVEHRSSWRDHTWSVDFALLGGELTNSPKEGDTGEAEVKNWVFAVTNLKLPTKTSLEIDGRVLRFEPAPNHDRTVKQIQVTGGVGVTCFASVDAVEIGEPRQEVESILDDLCVLLSLAKGTRVEWISHEGFDSHSRVCMGYHRSAKTQPYSGVELIPGRPPSDLECFVKQTFENYRTIRDDWKLRQAILTYTEGKSETDFLESRGLKIAVATEILRARYSELYGRTGILTPELFAPASERLGKQMKIALQELFPDSDPARFDEMLKHVAGLNRPTFLSIIREMVEAAGLVTDKHAPWKFKEIRNHLVHSGDFPERQGSPAEQFFFMATFVGRLFLALLGYDGHYYDWTKEPPSRVQLKRLIEDSGSGTEIPSDERFK